MEAAILYSVFAVSAAAASLRHTNLDFLLWICFGSPNRGLGRAEVKQKHLPVEYW